jgi:DNA-binding NarL/FixJ family response regulator
VTAGDGAATRPVRVLLVDAAPMQRAGLRMALSETAAPAAGTAPPAAQDPATTGSTMSARKAAPGAIWAPAHRSPAHESWTGGIRAALTVVGEASDGVEAVDLTRRLLPDVVVMDIALPRLDGLRAARAIRQSGLPVRVLILARQDGDEQVVAAIAAGAAGFLRKDVPAADLVAAVRTVATGGAVLAPLVLARLLGRFADSLPDPATTATDALAGLTEREREVLVHVARGHSNAEIAQALTVSETTIKTHVGHVLTKLRLRDRTQAVVLAYESGLIKPGT